MRVGTVKTSSSVVAAWLSAGTSRYRRSDETPAISTGVDGLDALLPAGGFRAGSIAEWIAGDEGAGAMTLASRAGWEACRNGRSFVVIDPSKEIQPPALLRWGLPGCRLLVIHPTHRRETLWAWEECLRCRGVGAVMGSLDRLIGHEGRRLMLAAERGNTLGLLIRPRLAVRTPTWGDERLWVEPVARCGADEEQRVRVRHLRSRHGAEGKSVELCIDEQACVVRLATELGHPMANPPALRA